MECPHCHGQMKQNNIMIGDADLQPNYVYSCDPCASTIMLFDVGTDELVMLWLEEYEPPMSMRALVQERVDERQQ